MHTPLPHSPAWPLARSVSLTMLAFSLIVVALLAYMNRELISAPVQDRFVTERQNQRDPFRLSGCIGLDLSAQGTACAPDQAQLLSGWLRHADPLVTRLHQYTAAVRGRSPNVQVLQAVPGLETPVAQGRHVRLGISPDVQTLAHITADCFAGSLAACLQCDWCDGGARHEMYEKARARAMGILVVDVKTGAIEAAASGYTACYDQQHNGRPPSAQCPVLPNTLVPHLDRLGNQALDQTAKPGSITKVPIAVGLLQAGLSAAEAAKLPRILAHSRTPELIDLVMCQTQDFDPACARQRLGAVARAAQSMGWTGWSDVLAAGQIPGLNAPRYTAQMLSQLNPAPQPHASQLAAPPVGKLQREQLRDCARKRWSGCSGENQVNLLAELFGTGQALASPVGVANAFLHLAAAANGSAQAAQAHLVVAAQDDAGNARSVQSQTAPQVNATHARLVLDGLALATTQGTAASACRAATNALPGGLLPCAPRTKTASPLAAPIRIAGKTGTPIFSADVGQKISKPLPQWRTECADLRRQLTHTAQSGAQWHRLKNEVGKCNMLPIKWYATLVSAPGSATWDKVVVVLAERNWNQHTQQIDSPNDSGPNVATEAALSLVNALYHPQRKRPAGHGAAS